ncbi:MAG: GFA family protein, partial [Cyanobacteria bacterium J06659_2]
MSSQDIHRQSTMLSGSCLCGTVQISVKGQLEHDPEACHCVQCRKQTGSFLIAVNVRKTALSVAGEDSIHWYRSSDKVERGFCSVCGSTLFWRPDIEGYKWISIAMGL